MQFPNHKRHFIRYVNIINRKAFKLKLEKNYYENKCKKSLPETHTLLSLPLHYLCDIRLDAQPPIASFVVMYLVVQLWHKCVLVHMKSLNVYWHTPVLRKNSFYIVSLALLLLMSEENCVLRII